MVCRRVRLRKTAIRISICRQLRIKAWVLCQMQVCALPLISRTRKATVKFTRQHPMAWQISPEKGPCQYTSAIQLCTRRTDSLTTPDFQFHQLTLPSHISTPTTCNHSNLRIRKLAAECALWLTITWRLAATRSTLPNVCTQTIGTLMHITAELTIQITILASSLQTSWWHRCVALEYPTLLSNLMCYIQSMGWARKRLCVTMSIMTLTNLVRESQSL